MQKYLENQKFLYSIIIVLLLIGILETTYLFKNKNKDNFNEVYAGITNEEKEVSVIDDDITIDLKGEVKNPGVYTISKNIIINDIIKKAGGFTKDAYKDNINLSKKLDNEQVLYIYSKKEYKNLNKANNYDKCETKTIYIDTCIKEGSSIITNTNDPVETIEDEKTEEIPTESKLININTATISELITLIGIGEAKAEDIIFYREKNGPFETIEDLKNVSGIGDKTFDKIKDFITV